MKTAQGIFLTVGVPIETDAGRPSYEDFRAFNEQDIAKIQREAFLAGEESFRLAYRQELESLNERSK